MTAPPVTDTERADIVAAYLAGASLRDAAARYGRSYSVAWRSLDAAGIPRRKPGRAPGPEPTPAPRRTRPPQRPVTAEEQAEIVKAYVTGTSINNCAALFRRSKRVIMDALDAAGVKRRRPGPRLTVLTRHFCGESVRHRPHTGCNGYGSFAGPQHKLCPLRNPHDKHRGCDGLGEL